MKRYYRYSIALVALVIGLWSVYAERSLLLPFLSLVVGVYSLAAEKQTRDELRKKEEAIRELINEKSVIKTKVEKQEKELESIESNLTEAKQEAELLRNKKKRRNQRLQNLKRVLRREGIDTGYLINKYTNPLRAPVMVLTHFDSPNHNNKEGAKLIRDNLSTLDAKTLHGATKIIPPRNFDQNIKTREELQEWFDKEILGGDDNLSHRLELLSIVDIHRVFDRNKADPDREGYPAHTVSELFDTDTVVPTKDLVDILARSERISIEEELRDNIALLAVSEASEKQMDEIISNQTEIQERLGSLDQVANTPVERINEVLLKFNVPHADQLAKSIQTEAENLQAILE